MTEWKMEGAGPRVLHDLADAMGVADGATVVVSDRVMGTLTRTNPTLALGFDRDRAPQGDCLTAGQVVLALMLGHKVLLGGVRVTKAEVHNDGSILLWTDDDEWDGYEMTEVVPGAHRVEPERV